MTESSLDHAAITVRRATSGDVPAILACLARTFESYRDEYTPMAFDQTVMTAATLQDRLERMHVFVVTTDDDRTVCGTLSTDMLTETEGQLRGMAVRPEHQGRGVARAMIRVALADLRTRRCRRVTLDTATPLTRAMRLYESFGFRATGRINLFHGMPLTEYAMELADVVTVGLVGGLGPESTIAYYRQILSGYRARRPDGSAPSIVIISLDTNRLMGLVGAARYDELFEYLHAEVNRLADAGATFAALTANTAHLVFDRLAAQSPIPLLSIVAVTRDAAAARGLRRLGLFGTRFTMEAALYPDLFEAAGMSVIVPTVEERELIHDRYLTELVPGVFRAETRAVFLGIVDRMMREDGIDGVILGGTEVPLLLTEPDYMGIPLLDTTGLHALAIVDRLLA